MTRSFQLIGWLTSGMGLEEPGEAVLALMPTAMGPARVEWAPAQPLKGM